VVAQRAGTPPPAEMVLSGIIPPLADSYFQRQETGIDLKAGLFPGETAVLIHGEETAAAPAAQGGTGKTQLAVEYTHALRSARAVDVLVWVIAASREAVVAGFAQAASAVGADDPDADALAAAGRFTAWLARTERRWALILDDLADLADLEGLWPTGPNGQIVITTRLPGAAFGVGAHAAAGGLRITPVGGFSRREALSYLSSRLTDYADQRIEALDLAEDLDGLPIGLAQAAAVMNANRLSCQEYRAQYGERRAYMSARPVAGVSPAILATWSLAAECAHQLVPTGLAWPGLALTGVLDPHGIPAAVLTSPAACGFIAGRPSSATGPDQNLARTAVTNLARVGLVSVDPANAIRTVRMHRCVQAAIRAYLPPADNGQTKEAVDRYKSLLADYEAMSGRDHPDTITARASLASAFRRSGRSKDAIAQYKRVLEDRERTVGADHLDTIAARANLAFAYRSAGQLREAIRDYERTLADRERVQGPDHGDTRAGRCNLAAAYQQAGRLGEAIQQYERALADSERYRGPGDLETLTTQANLASALYADGRLMEAVAVLQRALADSERYRGPDHPMTKTMRDNLDAATRT